MTHEFIRGYSSDDRERIAFQWNGKHATDFADANQEFRWAVVQACIAEPSLAPLALLEDLFHADAEWSVQAWCSPRHFPQLAECLLSRGEAAVPAFAAGFARSFDTFGACHGIHVPPELVNRLLIETRALQAKVEDQQEGKNLGFAGELFEKLLSGTASKGWVTVAPGTPVRNVRVVWPRWYHKLYSKLAAIWRKRAA